MATEKLKVNQIVADTLSHYEVSSSSCTTLPAVISSQVFWFTAGEIDDCEICSNHLGMIAKILNGKTVSVILL